MIVRQIDDQSIDKLNSVNMTFVTSFFTNYPGNKAINHKTNIYILLRNLALEINVATYLQECPVPGL